MDNKADFSKLLEVYTAVVISPKGVLTSTDRGVKPMLGWLEECPEYLEGAMLIDRVIGAAAGNLAHLGKIKRIYTNLISDNGIEVLEKYGIEYEYREKTPAIRNRDNTDLCPMEKLSMGVEDSNEVLSRIKNFFKDSD